MSVFQYSSVRTSENQQSLPQAKNVRNYTVFEHFSSNMSQQNQLQAARRRRKFPGITVVLAIFEHFSSLLEENYTVFDHFGSRLGSGANRLEAGEWDLGITD